VAAFIQGQNTLSATTNKAIATVQAPGGGFIGGAACATPVVPLGLQPDVQNQ
jgi:multisubunit Na+/H+ antiporter MnhB subunit